MCYEYQYFNKWFDVLFDKQLNYCFSFKKNIIRFFSYIYF